MKVLFLPILATFLISAHETPSDPNALSNPVFSKPAKKWDNLIEVYRLPKEKCEDRMRQTDFVGDEVRSKNELERPLFVKTVDIRKDGCGVMYVRNEAGVLEEMLVPKSDDEPKIIPARK